MAPFFNPRPSTTAGDANSSDTTTSTDFDDYESMPPFVMKSDPMLFDSISSSNSIINSNCDARSQESPQSPIFPVSKLSSAALIYRGATKTLDNHKWQIGIMGSLISVLEFRKEYNASAPRPGRFLRALRPALRSLPDNVVGVAGGHVIFAGAKDLHVGEPMGVSMGFLGASILGVALALADRRSGIVFAGHIAGACYCAGTAFFLGSFIEQEQYDDDDRAKSE